MNSNNVLDSLCAAIAASGDARLLGPALDQCRDASDLARVLDQGRDLDLTVLDDDERSRVGALALEAGAWALALKAAQGVDRALASEVTALFRLDRAGDAMARYHAAVASNPALEQPDLVAMIEREKGESTNVVTLNARRRESESPEDDELIEARLSFVRTESSIGFDDVAGHDDVKRQISRRIIAPFQKPMLFARFRRAAGGGVLLYGPPGCGKTLIARATAGECGARFINVPATDIVDKYVGEPERKLAAIFEEARRETPTVLFFDEIEALAGKRGSQSTRHEMGLVSTFLAELDGFEKANKGVLILAATNMPWAVDAAFRRSGRFDRLLFVPPPDRTARRAILELQLAGRPVQAGLDLEAVAARATGFSGADIENLVDTAADLAIEESIDAGTEQPIGQRHLIESFSEVKPTTAEWLTTARNFARYGNSGGQYDEIAEFLKRHAK
ncbi:ATP-binding protein [Sphingomonas sp. HF-S3]|uniref:ATP-binding protein n=1 Tax=Sphingomonas rustica TaxID=3103142 RepID=A0ABV0B481_9SPHN